MYPGDDEGRAFIDELCDDLFPRPESPQRFIPLNCVKASREQLIEMQEHLNPTSEVKAKRRREPVEARFSPDPESELNHDLEWPNPGAHVAPPHPPREHATCS